MNNRAFNIIVGEFNGSLESLLEMVQKKKMPISNVPLAQVADDYIAYVRSLEHVPSAEMASFIVVATTLLLIKSKSLLPHLDLSDEEEDSIQGLEERLALYAIYRQAIDVLIEHCKTQLPLSIPKSRRVDTTVFAPSEGLSIESLHGAMQGVMAQLPVATEKERATIEESLNIEEVMQDLLQRVTGSIKQSFNTLAGADRQEVLVSFLALLELVKNGVLLAEQGGTYGEIMVEGNVI